MKWYSLAALALTLVGMAIMASSLLRARDLFDAVPFVRGIRRDRIERYLRLHVMLIVFFLSGYIVISMAFIFELAFLSEFMMGAIFLLGAVFVFLGCVMQSALFGELGRTLHGLIPVCVMCKKVRAADSDPKDQASWISLEDYVSEVAGAELSHGSCPACAEKMVRDVEEQEC